MTTSSESVARITPSSYLTLHYRLSTCSNVDIISTFAASPATLQLGAGQLLAALEQKLIGLREGERCVITLSPEDAFGVHNPDLVQLVASAMFKEHATLDDKLGVGDMLQFTASKGDRFAGVLRRIDEESCVVDFNHPLAGQSIIFEAHIIGIL